MNNIQVQPLHRERVKEENQLEYASDLESSPDRADVGPSDTKGQVGRGKGKRKADHSEPEMDKDGKKIKRLGASWISLGARTYPSLIPQSEELLRM